MMTLAVLLLATAAAGRAALVATLRARTRTRVHCDDRAESWTDVARRLVAPLFERNADRTIERELPNVLDGVARSLRSGSSLRQAIDEACVSARGALGRDLSHVRRALAAGAPLTDALSRWAADRPLPGVRLAVAALSLGAETGGASAQAVDGVTATIRTNLAIAGEVRA